MATRRVIKIEPPDRFACSASSETHCKRQCAGTTTDRPRESQPPTRPGRANDRSRNKKGDILKMSYVWH